MSPSSDSRLLAGALQLAAAGLRVHPLNAKVALMKDWPRLASSDPGTVRSFWRRYPNANPGVVTGGDGFFILDVDVKHGGLREADALTARWGPLPRCPVVRTGGGGWHLYLRAPGPVRNSRSKVAPGIDVRGIGGYAVAPPSRHKSGASYVWARHCTITDVPIPLAPEWLLERLHAPVVLDARPRPQLLCDVDNVTRARRYLAVLPPAISGSGGHDATWRAALALVRGFRLPQEVALDLLLHDYNLRCEPPWTDRDLRHKVVSAANDATAEWGYLLERRRA